MTDKSGRLPGDKIRRARRTFAAPLATRHALALFLALAGCAPEKSPEVGPRPLLLGSRTFTVEPERWYFDRARRPRIRLPAGADAQIEWGGRPIQTQPAGTHAGWRFVQLVEDPPGGKAELTVRWPGQRHRWPVEWGEPPDALPGLAEAVAARKAGRLEASAIALAEAPEGTSFWAGVERARLARRQGDHAAAGSLAFESADAAKTAAMPGEAARRYRLASIYWREAGDLTRAQQAVVAAERVADDLESLTKTRFNQGQIARAQHRFQAASMRIEEALSGAQATGDARSEVFFRQYYAQLSQELGRRTFAAELIEQLPIRRWLDLNNWAFLAWRSAQRCAGNRSFLPIFEMVAATIPPHHPPAYRHDAWVELAAAALADGYLPRAIDALDEARRQDGSGGTEPLTAELLEVELSFALGDFDATHAAAIELLTRARDITGSADNDTAWRALHLLGRALQQLHGQGAGLAAWYEGLAMLDRLGQGLAIRGARSSFLAERRALVADIVRTHLEAGETASAFAVVDAQRMPALRRLAADARTSGLREEALVEWGRRLEAHESARKAVVKQREACLTASAAKVESCQAETRRLRTAAKATFGQAADWLDEVAPQSNTFEFHPGLLGKDEALLAFVRLPQPDGCNDEWRGFLVADGQIEHRAVDGEMPWKDALAQHRRVYVVDGGYGPARDLAENLGTQVELSYLPAAWLLARRVPPLEDRTLVVADPKGDLPFARKTAEFVNASVALVGTEATRAAVLEQIDGLRWLHYDGHGDLAQGDPFAAHLRLADGALTATDLLVHRPSIGLVVLAGCETARAQALSDVEGLGLAEAFLLAGAQTVLAADRVLPDDQAARFSAAFHAAGGTASPAGALLQVRREMKAKGDPAWRGWRLFGR